MRRSLQSRTPTEGALCTSAAPCWASSRAVSWPITRQLPTAMNSVVQPTQSRARCSRTREMSPARLVFSTSKKMPRRREGRGGSGSGGRTRAANPASGTPVTITASTGASTAGSGSGGRGFGGELCGYRLRFGGLGLGLARA